MIKTSRDDRILASGLVLYLILDVLLTPAGLESRPISGITNAGLLGLGLLFVGLVLASASLVLVFFKPWRSPILAVVGTLLYFPAFLEDQAGIFAALRPSETIEVVELAQALVAIAVIILALRARRKVANQSSR